MHLRNKFFIFISLLVILIIGSLVITSYMILNKTLLENNRIYSLNLTDQLATSVYFVTSHFEEKVRRGIQSSLIQNGNYQLDSPHLSQYEKNFILDDFFLHLLYPPIGLQDIYYITSGNNQYWKSIRFNKNTLFHEKVLAEMVKKKPFFESYWGEFLWFSLPDSDDIIYMGTAIYNPATIEPSGILMVGISRNYLTSQFKGYNAALGGDIVIFNRDGEIVFTNQPEKLKDIIPLLDPLGQEWDREKKITESVHFNNEGYLLTWDSFKDKRLIICHIISAARLKEPTLLIEKLLLLLGVAALILSLFLSYFLAGLITKRIILLHEQIDYIKKGHFSNRVNPMGQDEIGLLGDSFNDMTAHLQETLKKLAQEEVQLKETELRAVQSEYKALQSQINPHFLYNTLESVNSLAKMEGQEEISTIVTSLARLFRNSLKSQKQFYTLEEEINYSKDYLTIQEKLQADRWNVEWEIDKKYLNQSIPRFSLQPLLENALNHGMEKILSQGLIIIHTYKEGEDKFILEVSDNGRGIKREKLQILREELKENRETDHHGLLSVHRRIRLLWGNDYGLTLESDGETGTTCRLILPWKEKQCTEF